MPAGELQPAAFVSIAVRKTVPELPAVKVICLVVPPDVIEPLVIPQR